MMRIEGVARERAGMFARLTYWFSERRFGKVADSLTVMAHQTWVLFASAMYELGSERARAVETTVESTSPDQSGHSRWLPVLNRHWFCRRQKGRRLRGTAQQSVRLLGELSILFPRETGS